MDIKNITSEFNMITTCMKKLNFENNYILLDNDSSKNKNIDVSYTCSKLNLSDSAEDKKGVVTLYITAHRDGQHNNLDFYMEIDGYFHAPLEMDDEKFIRMLKYNGCAAVYSVARANIMSITALTLYEGCIVLPMINVFKLNEEMQKKIDEA